MTMELSTEEIFARDDILAETGKLTAPANVGGTFVSSSDAGLGSRTIDDTDERDPKPRGLNQSRVIPSLRRSNRSNKGVSKEVFDPSHIPSPKHRLYAHTQIQNNRAMSRSPETRRRHSSESENKKRHLSEEKISKVAHEEEKEESEDSDSDSDDDGYNDPNKLWCICQKPHNGRFMISCDMCEEWFHGDCVGVTVQRGKQMEKRGEEYVCPSCLKNMGKRTAKLGGESGYESSKNKGLNLKGYAHGKDDKKSQGVKRQKRKRIREGTEKESNKSNVSKSSSTSRKCIVSNCQNEAQADSVYCSNVCILRHAKESLGEITKAKKHTNKMPSSNKKLDSKQHHLKDSAEGKRERPQAVRVHSVDGKKETREEKIMRKIREAASNGKVAVYSTKTGKIFSGASAPSKSRLHAFLEQNPTFQQLKPPRTVRQNESEGKSYKHKLSYSDDPPYKPAESKPTNPYKPQTIPKHEGNQKSKKHKIERRDSVEKSAKHKKLEHERRHSIEKGTPQKVTAHKRESRTFSDERTETKKETTPQKEREVRKNVQKTLLSILQQRSETSEDLKMHPDSIYRLVNKIEESLYKLFTGVTSKYKNRYRSIMFNLKDEKNQGLWRKVILGEVSSSSLVKMTPEEMASKELAQWRQHELTQELEMIHELEIAKRNIRPVAKITHKGEIAINEDFSDLTDSHLDDTQEKGGPSIAPHRIRRISANQSDAPQEIPTQALSNDTTLEHNSHLFDLNCRICTGQVKEEEVQLEDSNQKKVKRSTSIIMSNEAQSTAETYHSEEEILKKISAFNKKQEKFTVPSPSHHPVEETDKVDQDLVPVSPENDYFTDKSGEDTLKQVSSTESVSPKDKTPPAPAKLSREHFLWTGVISMPELSSFHTNAYSVSGGTRELINAIPAKLVLDGRIHPKVVWEYLSKVSAFPNKEVCVIQFRASSEDDRVGYVSMLSYFSSRRRFGVVSNQNTQVIKDIYLVPLLESDSIPQQLLPFRGPGIPKNHPSMLLGVIVRCIPEAPQRKGSSELETLKLPDKNRQTLEKSKSDIESEANKISLLERNRLLTPVMPQFTQKILDKVGTNEDDEEEYNPETANFDDLTEEDLPEQTQQKAAAEADDEAYDPEKLVFDDEMEEDNTPYDPEVEAERLEHSELQALQEKQALLEKMKQELEMKKAELAKEERSLQQTPPPPPPSKVMSKPLVDPRIVARMNSKSKAATNNSTVTPSSEPSPLQKIFSVLNMDKPSNS